MFRGLVLVYLATCLIGCRDGNIESDIEQNMDPVPSIEHLGISVSEQAYKSFNTTVIDNQKYLTRFKERVMAAQGWQHKTYKEEFDQVLTGRDIDFKNYNLLIYRYTEDSKSIYPFPQPPIVEGEKVSVKVLREIPDIGESRVSYNAFAYKVKKSIKTVEFDFTGDKADAVIKNQVAENIAPLNCKSWFDGCNLCDRTEDGLADCDQDSCEVYDTLHCKVWDESAEPEVEGVLASIDDVERINVSFKSSDFNLLKTSVIDSQEAMDDVIEILKVDMQDFKPEHITSVPWKWRDKTLKTLQDADIDFSQFNVIFHTFTDGSVSNVLTPLAPKLEEDGSVAVISIDRAVANPGDASIAFHTLAYKVNKSIAEIHFHHSDTVVEKYVNTVSERSTPLNCQAIWWCVNIPPIVASVELIDTPLREHGYSNFNTEIITSERSYNRFLEKVLEQDNWNNRSKFINVLVSSAPDFSTHNIVLYRHTESSGSVGVTVGDAAYSDDRVSFKVSRDVPEVGTDDKAYYAFVYKVKKTIRKIEFTFGENKKSIIANNFGENVVPLNCKTWFDGCNECVRTEDGTAACDDAFCEVYDTLNCHTWD